MAKSKSLATKLQATIVIVLVSLLSLVFLLEFGGPQAKGCAQGPGDTYAAKVDGRVITTGDFEAAYVLAGFNQQPLEMQRSRHLRQIVLEGLVERTLLAREARRMGFDITDEEVWRHLGDEGTVFLTLGVNAPRDLGQGEVRVPVRNEKGDFDTEQAKRFIQYYLRRSIGEFGEAQQQEMLAERARGVIRATVSVSPEEIWDTFRREQEKVRMAWVRFSPSYYRDRIEPTSSELDAWIAKHGDELDREYQANKHRYTDLQKQVHARHILIRVPSDADDETVAEKRKLAEDVLTKVRAGGDFAELAREYSEDPGSAPRGGDLGWNPQGKMVPAFDEAMFSLEPGQVSDLVKTQFGFHIIEVLGVREGDVPEKEAKREIAGRLYREEKAEQRAEQAAKRALAKLKAGTDLDALDAELAGRSPGSEPPSEEQDDRPPNAPQVERTEAFARGQNPLPAGIDAAPIVQAAFEHSEEDPLPGQPLHAGRDWVVFQVLEHTQADREDFTEEAQQRLYSQLREEKADETLRIYVERLKAQAEDDDTIKVNESVLSYGDEEGPAGAS